MLVKHDLPFIHYFVSCSKTVLKFFTSFSSPVWTFNVVTNLQVFNFGPTTLVIQDETT